MTHGTNGGRDAACSLPAERLGRSRSVKNWILFALGSVVLACDGEHPAVDPADTDLQEFNPSPDPRAIKGHAQITKKAFELLRDRGMLPALLQSEHNQNLVLYGNNFADHGEAGRPNPDNDPALGQDFYPGVQLANLMDARTGGTGSTGVLHAETFGNFTFSSRYDLGPLGGDLSLSVDSHASIVWVSAGGTSSGDNPFVYPSTSLRWRLRLDPVLCVPGSFFCSNADVVTMVHRVKGLNQDHVADNLYHYTLGDVRYFANPEVGDGQTALKAYPMLPSHSADPNDANETRIAENIMTRLTNQRLLADADYGNTTYGAVLYQLARKFFVASASEPDIAELVKVGNDVPGWRTGRMRTHGELNEMQLEMPHTYLGGMPHVCAGSTSTDPCASGRPTWPPWIKASPVSGMALSQLETARPGRSDQAALIYLGWATHMMQDASVPHHAANWTGKEHENQDNLGDQPYYYADYSILPWPFSAYGQYWVNRRIQAELDLLLGPASAPRQRGEICRSIGITPQQVELGALHWQRVQGVFLANAKEAYSRRQAILLDADKPAAGADYVKSAVLGTLKLLLCAVPGDDLGGGKDPLVRPRVFQRNLMAGAVQTLDLGMYDAAWPGPHGLLSVGDNQISSLEVPLGYNVTLFDGPRLTGQSRSFGPGLHRDVGTFDNLTSSLLVTRNGESGTFFLRLKRDYVDVYQSNEAAYRRDMMENRYLAVFGSDVFSHAWAYLQEWRYDATTRAIKNVSTGLCLAVRGGSPSSGALVDALACNGGSAQRWELTATGQIQNANGKCLGATKLGVFSIPMVNMTIGARVEMRDCVIPDGQAFDIAYGCRHDPCKVGAALPAGCSADVAEVCEVDPFCCTSSWQSSCVSRARSCTSCVDGLKNGSETDVDCGGSCSVRCASGKRCATASDCVSAACSGGFCS